MFELMYQRFFKLVMSHFSKKGVSYEESRDLTQDVFTNALKSYSVGTPIAHEKAWLMAIADNQFKNWLRSNKAQKNSGTELSMDDEEGIGDLPSKDESQEHLLLKQERLRFVRAAMEQLPPQMRRCMIMRYDRKQDFKVIASTMRLSQSAVRSQITLAKKQLKRLLADRYHDDLPGEEN